MKKIFSPDQFTATYFDSAEDKAKFANYIIHFIDNGYEKSLFKKWFYRLLSLSFQHIAHFDKHGFYAEWFSTEASRAKWLEYVMTQPIYGEATHTRCDVERAVQQYLRDHPEIFRKQEGLAIAENNGLAKQTAKAALGQLSPEERKEILEQL